jgi:DNA-binding response OmpR family regulator
MTQQRHRALIVEDDLELAGDLRDILTACGCDSEITTNRQDAMAQIEKATFCILILDLQIKAEPDSSRAHAEHGKQLLKDARARSPQMSGVRYSLPIVILSGFASEREVAIELMREGASDVVQKLSTAEFKADRIHKALEESGRTSHRVCQDRHAEQLTALTLSIPGVQDGRRVVVRIGQRQAKLTHGSLKVLLQLIKGRLSGSMVHKNELGARSEQGFRGVSVLREQLAAAHEGDGRELVTNDQRGSYALADHLTIGEVATAQLERIGNHQVSKLAREIQRLFGHIAESAGKD